MGLFEMSFFELVGAAFNLLFVIGLLSLPGIISMIHDHYKKKKPYKPNEPKNYRMMGKNDIGFH